MMGNLALFEDIVSVPHTEGIKYAGSKLKLLPHILSLAQSVKPKIVLDGFAGTTRVSQAFAQQGYTVLSNDISAWSKVFASCYLLNERPAAYYKPMLEHLNHLPPLEGWFTQHYGGEVNDSSSSITGGLKKPWQKHNAMRLDAIRDEIERLTLSETEKAVLLTSLIYALDEVDSTLGHFASYLSEWSPRSYKNFKLKIPTLIPKTAPHEATQGDIFDLLPNKTVDLAYFDPPYGSNNEKMPPSRVRYQAYYHLWTSICLNDKPELFGKAKRRTDTSDTISASVFEEFRRNENGQLIAVEAIKNVIADVNANYVLLSYSSGGRATAEQLNDALTQNGRLIETLEVDYRKNVMANMRWTNEWINHAEQPNKEFLFLIEKK